MSSVSGTVVDGSGSAALSTTSARWQRTADRLARYAWVILLVAVTLALIGGAVSAVAWQPSSSDAQTQVVVCESPPCFGLDGLPGAQDIPWMISTFGYVLVILLGVPSLLAGSWDLLRGRTVAAARRVLVFVGPLLVFTLIELLPHLVNPCTIPYELGSRNLLAICETNPEWGADVASRYHLIDHALVGALPLTVLYWLALRRWRPDVARLRGHLMSHPFSV